MRTWGLTAFEPTHVRRLDSGTRISALRRMHRLRTPTGGYGIEKNIADHKTIYYNNNIIIVIFPFNVLTFH